MKKGEAGSSSGGEQGARAGAEQRAGEEDGALVLAWCSSSNARRVLKHGGWSKGRAELSKAALRGLLFGCSEQAGWVLGCSPVAARGASEALPVPERRGPGELF